MTQRRRSSLLQSRHARNADGHTAVRAVTGSIAPGPAVESVTIMAARSSNHIGGRTLSRGSTTGTVFANHPGIQAVESRRVTNGSVEVHDDWMDATLVQAGRAQLNSGGSVAGSALSAPGEHRGGTITGGSTHAISTGDFFIVPAGVPHQFLVSRGDSIVYLTIKVPRAR